MELACCKWLKKWIMMKYTFKKDETVNAWKLYNNLIKLRKWSLNDWISRIIASNKIWGLKGLSNTNNTVNQLNSLFNYDSFFVPAYTYFLIFHIFSVFIFTYFDFLIFPYFFSKTLAISFFRQNTWGVGLFHCWVR